MNIYLLYFVVAVFMWLLENLYHRGGSSRVLVAALKAQPQLGAGCSGDEVLAILGLGAVGGTDDSK